MKKLFFLCVSVFTLTLFYSSAHGQINSGQNNVDQVFDRFGNAYPIKDIQLATPAPQATMMRGSQTIDVQTCLAGDEFELYFERGSGFHTSDTDADFNNQTSGINPLENQQIACAVFSQLSAFINSQIDSTDSTRVRIWFRSMEEVLDIDDANLLDNEAQTLNVLAFASSYYSLLFNGLTPEAEITDGLVWQTLNTGVDPYLTIPSALAITGGNQSPYFHGFMAFNFFNPDIAPNWAHDMSGANVGLNYDLFSILLHEATHILGFNSLIDSDGGSAMGLGFNYYSRLDRLIRDSTATDFLIQPMDSLCVMYNNIFAADSSVLTPDFEDPCPHNPTIMVWGEPIKLFSDSVFHPGGTASHISRQCQQGAVACVANNSNFFVMDNSSDMAELVRSYQEIERNILCQMGYNLQIEFGDDSTSNHCSYDSICSPITVGGVNDGYSNGEFLYITEGFGVPFGLPANLPVRPAVWENDPGAIGFICLQVVQGAGVFEFGIDPPFVRQGFSYTPAPNTDGLHILSYIPVGPNGELGNITYIFIYVIASGCADLGCEVVTNGDFEISDVLVISNGEHVGEISCWRPVFGHQLAIGEGDGFENNCPDTCDTPDDANLFDGGRTTGVCTYYHYPPSEVHPLSQDSATNFLLLNAVIDPDTHQRSTCVIQNYLGANLIPNQNYRLTFWAKVHNYGNSGSYTGSVPLKIGTMKHYLTFAPLPGGLTQVDPTISIPLAVPTNTTWDMDTTFWIADDIPQDTCASGQVGGELDWHPVTYEFTFGGTEPHGAIFIWIDPSAPVSNEQIISGHSSLFLDDISIVPFDLAHIDLPEHACGNQAPFLLQGTPSGGVFTGAGVTTQIVDGNTEYIFDQSLLPTGTTEAAVTYTVQTILGCDSTRVTDVIHVVNNPAPIITAQVLSNATCNTICNGEVDINVSSGTGDLTTTLIPDYPYNALCGDEFYLAIVTDSLECQDTVSFYISLLSQNCCALNIVFDSTHVSCDDFSNGSASITATGGLGALSYLWTGPGETTTVEDPTGLIEGTWTITVTDSAGCAATDSILIQNISLSLVTDSLQAACAGSANGAAWITVSGGSAPYTYSWSGPGGATSSVEDPTGIIAGNWNVLVTDANGCERLAAIAVDTLVIDIAIDQLVEACANSATGGAFVTIGGGLEPYTYQWTLTGQPSLYTQDISGVVPETWHLEVTDAMGCTSEIDVEIPELDWDIPYNATALHITSNTTWTGVQYIDRNIIVDEGFTLNVADATLFMGNGRYIIVQRAAKLKINNSTLTHACSNSYWGGIVVQGNQPGAYQFTNIANGYVEAHNYSNLNPSGQTEISYAQVGCQVGDAAWKGGQCYFDKTLFYNNKRNDVSLNRYNTTRIMRFDHCEFLVDNNYIDQMHQTDRVSVIMNTAVWKVDFNYCNWTYLNGNTTQMGMQTKDAVRGYGTGSFRNCNFKGYWTALNLTQPASLPLGGLILQKLIIRDCDIASYRGINLTGYSVLSVTIQDNVIHDIQSLNIPVLNANLTNQLTNSGGNTPGSPYSNTIVGANTNPNANAYQPSYGIRMKTCTDYKVSGNEIDMNAANLSQPLLLDRMGVYIDDCGNNSTPFQGNLVRMCTAALVYRNDNRAIGPFNQMLGASFQCNELKFNFDDVIVMSDITLPSDDVAIPEHGIRPILGDELHSPKNPMHTDLLIPQGDIRVEEQIFNTPDNSGHKYYWNDLAGTSNDELTEDLCEYISTQGVDDEILCSVNPPEGSNIIANLLSERANYKSSLTGIAQEIQEIMDGGNTQYLQDQITFTNYQNAIQTYYALIENSPNLSEEVLMQALDQYALPNPLLVEILASNPQAAKSNDVMDKVENRMIPFTEYQKAMIRNGMNLTSYLESLRYQRLQALTYSLQLLVNIKDLILEDSTIIDKKTELLNLYADEWLPSDLMFKMNLYATDGNIAAAEALEDLWPSYYNASADELQASHDYMWLAANNEVLADIEQALDAAQIQQLEQISRSILPEVAEWSKSILISRGLMEEEQLLDIPKRLNFRSQRESIVNPAVELYQLFPNPASDFTTITCSEDVQQDRVVNITDMAGRVVYQTIWKAGQRQLNIITNQFNSGVYLVQISGDYQIELMFVKQ
jgi:hypothetical protein